MSTDNHPTPDAIQYRSATIERAEAIDVEARTVRLAFSSEEPVERSFGNEVLSHADGDVDLSRLNDGAPLLLEHDRSQQIGVIERAWIDDEDSKGRAVVRFSKGARAQEIFQDVQDGIRRLVSVGYSVARFVNEKADEGLDTLRAVSWQPLEVSLVSVPADATVGVGRASETNPAPDNNQNTNNMENDNIRTEDAPVTAVETPKPEVRIEVRPDKRAEEIAALGKRFDANTEAIEHIAEGKSADDFKEYLMNRQAEAPQPVIEQQRDLGMDNKEVRRYSLTRAILGSLNGRLDGIEAEASAEIEKRFGQPAAGFYVPNDVLRGQRDLTAGGSDTGDKLVATNLGEFVPALDAEPVVVQLGARVMGGLSGNVSLPKGGTATAYWVDENGAATESTMTLGQVTLSPKRVVGYSELSKQLIVQSDLSVEQIVRDDLNRQLANAIDKAAIQGSGSSNEPTGVTNHSDVNQVTPSGSSHTLADVVSCEQEVEDDNALAGSLGYLMTPSVKKNLKTTSVDTGSGRFIMEGADLNGYRAASSTQVPANTLLFGDWSQLVIGEFGSGADVVVDQLSLATTGMVRITVSRLSDIALRHGQAFAKAVTS